MMFFPPYYLMEEVRKPPGIFFKTMRNLWKTANLSNRIGLAGYLSHHQRLKTPSNFHPTNHLLLFLQDDFNDTTGISSTVVIWSRTHSIQTQSPFIIWVWYPTLSHLRTSINMPDLICVSFYRSLLDRVYSKFPNSATGNTHMFTSHVSSPASHPMTTSAFSALARRVRIMNNAPSCSRRRGSSSPSTLPAHIKTMGRWDDMRITIHLFGYTMIAFWDHSQCFFGIIITNHPWH